MFTWKRIRKICDRKFIWLRSGHYYDHNGRKQTKCATAKGARDRDTETEESEPAIFDIFSRRSFFSAVWKILFIFVDVSVLSFFFLFSLSTLVRSHFFFIRSSFRYFVRIQFSSWWFVFILHPLAAVRNLFLSKLKYIFLLYLRSVW